VPADDRFPLPAVYAVLVVLGAAMGVWEAFLVPLRLPGGIEGLADVLAFGGNLGVGLLAGRALRDLPASAMSGIGWLVMVLVVGSVVRPADEVIIPGRLGPDPGIPVVGALLLLAGPLGAILAVVLTARFTRRAAPPTHNG
jgi:hypothetical protein